MGLLSVFRKRVHETVGETPLPVVQEPAEPRIRYEYVPDTVDLGWFWSQSNNEFQMAKIAQADRATHAYVIGASGSGKTKFLEFLIRQDIATGAGVGVIDPHGDLTEDLKGFLACRAACSGDTAEAARRLVLIDPTDPLYTVTFNPLEPLPNCSVTEQVGELISAFRKIWASAWGVRMEDLLRNALIALGEAGLSLTDLSRFLTTRTFRTHVLESVSHPIAREYFTRFDSLTDKGQLTWIEPVMNKINALFSDERIRQIFAAPKSSFNVREIMDNGNILLIKLDKGKLKDSADLMGSLLLAKIQMAAFSRSDIPRAERVPFHLYIDEFQNFATESFAVVLSEARKYGLSLTMAHQTLAQIPAELRSIILGNTGLQVYFRINRSDAELLVKEAFEYSGYTVKTEHSGTPSFWSYKEEWEHHIKDLQTLPPRFCFAKHKIEGGIIPIQTVEIEPPWQEAGMTAAAFAGFMADVPFASAYLVARDTFAAPTLPLEDETESAPATAVQVTEVSTEPAPCVPQVVPLPRADEEPAAPPARTMQPVLPKKKQAASAPSLPGKGGSQHKYLQFFIKRMAEEKGFRATVEEQIPGGSESVDVGLERDGIKIACEISLTTNPVHECANIRKCLTAGYDKVILCAPEKKVLEAVKKLSTAKLAAADMGKVLFLSPEDVFTFLEQEAARGASREVRVKGYKVNVRYQAVDDAEKQTKREAVGQVIVQSLRRMKK